jgi:uncharacterized damage-inducible protein DinB
MAATTSIRRSEPPIVRRWTPDPAGLAELWRHEAPRTLGVVAAFADRDLDYRPLEGARSIGETLAYLAASYDLTRRWLTDDAPPAAPAAAPASVHEALASLADRQQALFAVLDLLAPERFFDVIAPFGAPEHRGVMALGMFKHDLHYRGELYAYARACGHEPPDLYR